MPFFIIETYHAHEDSQIAGSAGEHGPFPTPADAINEAIRLISIATTLLLDEFSARQIDQAQADMESRHRATLKSKALTLCFEIEER